MRKWLYDNPWIWVVVFLATLIAASVATVIIAEVNKPEIVRPKEPRRARGGGPTSGTHFRGDPGSREPGFKSLAVLPISQHRD